MTQIWCNGKNNTKNAQKKSTFLNFFETYVQKVLINYKKSVNMGYMENLMRKRSKYMIWFSIIISYIE